jgi:hypothetical protein
MMSNNNDNNNDGAKSGDNFNGGVQQELLGILKQLSTRFDSLDSKFDELNIRVQNLEERKSGSSTPVKTTGSEKKIMFQQTEETDLKTPAALRKFSDIEINNTSLDEITADVLKSNLRDEDNISEHEVYMSEEESVSEHHVLGVNNNTTTDLKNKVRDKIFKSDKRRSALFKEMGNIKSSVEFNKVSYMKPVPDISHLSLDSTDPEKLITFYTGVLEITLESNVQVRVQTRIAKKIRDLICAKFDLQLVEYYNLSLEEIMVCLSKMVSPETQVKFVSLMKKCLKINIEYNKFRYEDYYYALLRYMQDFELLFKILAEDNMRVVPAVNDKSNGLIKLFGYHIDKKFFDDTRLLLGGSDKRYKTIYEFISDFKGIIMQYYQVYVSYKIVPDHRESNYKRYNGNANANAHDNNKHTDSRNQRYVKTQRLQNMSMYPNKDEDDEVEDSDHEHYSPWVQEPQHNFSDVEENIEEYDHEAVTEKHQQVDEDLNYLDSNDKLKIGKPATNSKTLPPCNWMATNGKCTLIDDPTHTQRYSHDASIIRERQNQIIANIKASQAISPPERILQHPRGSK